MSKRILVLEDNKDRITIFEEYFEVKYTDTLAYFCEDVNDAKKCFNDFKPFDVYYLDHDLGGEVYVDTSNPNTGTAFAKFLHEQGITGENEQIFIHSWNIEAAAGMQQYFRNSIRYPFNPKEMYKEIRNLQA